MELEIIVDSDRALEDSALLEKFLSEEHLTGITDIELKREPHLPGQQGLGKYVGNLIIKLIGAEDIVNGLITALSDFAAKYDRRIHLGAGIVIPTNKLTGDQIKEITIQVLQGQQAKKV